MKFIAAILTAIITLFAACHPVVTPTNDAGDGGVNYDASTDVSYAANDASSACLSACTALAAAGCLEGMISTCPYTLQEIDTGRIVRTPAGVALSCTAIAKVKAPADAVNLGVGCTRNTQK